MNYWNETIKTIKNESAITMHSLQEGTKVKENTNL
jgi:hypothetical protein